MRIWKSQSIARTLVISGPTGKLYVIGGYSANPTIATIVDTMMFATETTAQSSITFSPPNFGPASVQTTAKGYLLGGYETVATFTNSVRGITFSNDTGFNLGITLAGVRELAAGIYSSTKGFACGGYGSGPLNSITGILFSNETVVSSSATLNEVKYGPTGISSTTKGYISGGWGNTNNLSIDEYTFSNDTISTTLTMSTVRMYAYGVTTPTKGYWMGGGQSWDMSTPQVSAERINFSNDAMSVISTVLSTARDGGSAGQTSAKGYAVTGGSAYNAASYTGEIDGIDFTTETAINPAAAISTGRAWSGQASSAS